MSSEDNRLEFLSNYAELEYLAALERLERLERLESLSPEQLAQEINSSVEFFKQNPDYLNTLAATTRELIERAKADLNKEPS